VTSSKSVLSLKNKQDAYLPKASLRFLFKFLNLLKKKPNYQFGDFRLIFVAVTHLDSTVPEKIIFCQAFLKKFL